MLRLKLFAVFGIRLVKSFELPLARIEQGIIIGDTAKVAGDFKAIDFILPKALKILLLVI